MRSVIDAFDLHLWEGKKILSSVYSMTSHSDEVWDLSTWNDILFHFWWTGPDHPILLRTPWLMFTRNDYHVYSCSVIVIMNHGQRIYSVMIDPVPLELCAVFLLLVLVSIHRKLLLSSHAHAPSPSGCRAPLRLYGCCILQAVLDARSFFSLEF